jgi:hypothetical protein
MSAIAAVTRLDILDEFLQRTAGNKPADPVKVTGSALGGPVDLGWTVRQLMVLLYTWRFDHRHFWDVKFKNGFDIEDWATRKRSEAPAYFGAIVTSIAEMIFHTKFYPWLGRKIYNADNSYTFWVWYLLKATVNGWISILSIKLANGAGGVKNSWL